MKMKEMNAHQLTAFRIMKEVYNDYIGGLENGMQDYDKDSSEYEDCKNDLENHELLKETIYKLTIEEANRLGSAKHIRFAGKDFLLERIERRLLKENL